MIHMKLLAVVFSALTLAACGGGGNKASSTSSSTGTSLPETTSTIANTSTSVAPSTTSSTLVPVKDRCGVSQLQVTTLSQDAGAGNRYATFAMKNVGTVNCTLYGYPGAAAYAGARPIVTQATRLSNSEPVQTITLKPKDQAYFSIHYVAVPSGGKEQCETADTLQVTPPEATTQLMVAIELASLCPSGGLDVSPLTSKRPA